MLFACCVVLRRETYQMGRVLHIAVRPELGLDVLVSQDPHLGGKMLAVGAEEATVQRDRGQQRHGARSEALLGCRGG